MTTTNKSWTTSDSGRSGNPADGGFSVEGPRKRTRSDLSDSQDEEDGAVERVEDNADDEAPSPSKRSRDSLEGSERMNDDEEEDEDGEGAIRAQDMDDEDGDEEEGEARPDEVNVKRMDSSRLIIESTTHQESEIDIDLEDDDDEEDNDNLIGMGGGDGGAGSGQSDVDEQWTQAQEEKRQREERNRIRQAQARALEEQRQKEKAKREKERIEEGLRICRERAAEKARQEAAAAEKVKRERAEMEKQREAERLARDKQVDVDLDQCRTDSNLMSVMDSSVYDD